MAFENRTLAFLSSVFVTMTPSAVLPLVTTEARPVHPINDVAMYTFGGLMLTAGTVAVVGNIMVMYTFLSKSTLRKSAANIYTINLAFANTWLGIFGSVISFHIFQGKYATTAHCQAEGFFVSGIHITVIMTITCMIADRFHVICGKKTFCKVAHEKPKVIVAITWIYSFLWSAPPLSTLVPEYIEEPLIPSCIFDRFTNSLSNRLYIITMCTFVFFIPLVFICYCLYRIFWAVKSSSVLLAKYQGQRHIRKRRRRERGFTSESGGSEGISMMSAKQIQLNSSIRETKLGPVLPKKPMENEERVIEAPAKVEPLGMQREQSARLKPSEQNASSLSRAGSRKSQSSGKLSKSNSSRSKRGIQTIEFQILKSAVLLVVLFVSSWMPFTVAAIISIGSNQVSPYVILVSYLFAKASCVHSSFAYITNAHFRATIGLIRCKHTHRA